MKKVKNTLAYHSTKLIEAVKCLYVQPTLSFTGCWSNQHWVHKIDVDSPAKKYKAKFLDPESPRGSLKMDSANKKCHMACEKVKNALAYHSTKLIEAVKCHYVQAPWCGNIALHNFFTIARGVGGAGGGGKGYKQILCVSYMWK